jgi:hypothetical protein
MNKLNEDITNTTTTTAQDMKEATKGGTPQIGHVWNSHILILPHVVVELL